MTNKKQKSLTVANIKKEAKKYDEQISVQIGDYILKVDKNFRKTKRISYASEIMVQMQYAKEADIDIDSIFVPYMILMLIKHFSSLDIPSTINEQVAVLNLLIDNDMLDDILEAFPQDQVTQLFKETEEAVRRTNDIMYELEELFSGDITEEEFKLSDEEAHDEEN